MHGNQTRRNGLVFHRSFEFQHTVRRRNVKELVETLDQARQVLRYYKNRWACEEAAQFLMGRVGLESFRVRRYEAIRRLTILAMFAMGFLTWILLHSRDYRPCKGHSNIE